MTSLATYVIRHKKTKELWTTPKGKRQWTTKGAAALAWRNAYEGTAHGAYVARKDMERWPDLSIPMIVENGLSLVWLAERPQLSRINRLSRLSI